MSPRDRPVAGDVDIVLAPDLDAGNILAKYLEYLAGATLAGIVFRLAPLSLAELAAAFGLTLASVSGSQMLKRMRRSSTIYT